LQGQHISPDEIARSTEEFEEVHAAALMMLLTVLAVTVMLTLCLALIDDMWSRGDCVCISFGELQPPTPLATSDSARMRLPDGAAPVRLAGAPAPARAAGAPRSSLAPTSGPSGSSWAGPSGQYEMHLL
jgi:hypothetical protein